MIKQPKKPFKGLVGEDALQAQFCKILDLFKIRYYSIPNGIYISGWFAQWIYKMTGRKKGVPDLHVPIPIYIDNVLKFHSLYIETKLPRQYPDKEQREWHEYLRSVGHRVEVVRSCDELFSLMKECYPEKLTNIKT